MKKLIFLLAALSFSLSAQAQNPDDIYLGQPAYGGTGCPAGTAAAVLSPDAKTLSILFDEYVTEAGGATGVRIDRKSCNIAIPVHVPQGFAVSIFKVDYRGFNFLPRGAFSQFTAEYFFAGDRGPVVRRSFRGPEEELFTLTDDLVGVTTTWSRCGRDVNLRANTSIFLYNSNRRTEAITSVDSADVQAALVYHLQWRRCR